MTKTQQSRKEAKRNETESLVAWRKITIISIVIAAAIGVLFYIALARRPLYGVTATDARNQMTSILDKIQPASAKLAYSAISDKGCNDLGSVGLAKITNCNMIGYKYFKVQGNVKEAARSIDATLTHNGWARPYQNGNNNFQQIMNGTPADSVTYTLTSANHINPIVELAIYNPGHPFDAAEISQLVEEGKISSPSDGESLIGVSVSETYWSCSEENLFQLPCPTPPSNLKN